MKTFGSLTQLFPVQNHKFELTARETKPDDLLFLLKNELSN